MEEKNIVSRFGIITFNIKHRKKRESTFVISKILDGKDFGV